MFLKYKQPLRPTLLPRGYYRIIRSKYPFVSALHYFRR